MNSAHSTRNTSHRIPRDDATFRSDLTSATGDVPRRTRARHQGKRPALPAMTTWDRSGSIRVGTPNRPVTDERFHRSVQLAAYDRLGDDAITPPAVNGAIARPRLRCPRAMQALGKRARCARPASTGELRPRGLDACRCSFPAAPTREGDGSPSRGRGALGPRRSADEGPRRPVPITVGLDDCAPRMTVVSVDALLDERRGR